MQAVLDIQLDFSLTSPGRRFDLSVAFQSHTLRTALLGPSGSGKSATLRAIAGLMRPDHGHVRVADTCYFDTATSVDVPVRQRHVGLVFQDYALFPHLSVEDNIGFALRRIGHSMTHGQREHVETLLQRFGIEALRASFPRHLSGGQRQRVALARALASQPRLLLLDEPFAALDTHLRAQLRQEMAELLASVPIPLLLVTHDEADVQALTQSVVRLEQGRVAGV